MNGLIKEIFESFQVRKTKKQKTAFLGYLRGFAEERGYSHLTVRLVFDPPTQAALLASMERRLSKLEWRLNVKCDST